MRTWLVPCGVVASLWIGCGVAVASGMEWQAKSLVGLRSASVLILIGKGEPTFGLAVDSTRLATSLELKLREAGIRVVGGADSADPTGAAIVIVGLNAMQACGDEKSGEPATYATSIEVSVTRRIWIGESRSRAQSTAGVVWSEDLVEWVSRRTLNDSLVEAVDLMATSLANDWLKSNPR